MAGADIQTRMMERLLGDPEFRARFRRNPSAVAREEGAEELADELAVTRDPMQTLDFRESRSSVAGVMMAAAVEGIGIYELGRNFLPGIEHAQAASAGVPSNSGSSAGLDPDQYGAQGTGGAPSSHALALLENKKVTFDAAGIADLKGGQMDPRTVSLLGAISEKHRITVSTTTSDHAKLTEGGSVSNHYYGRAVDIAMVDGQPVNAGNQAARQLAEELSSVDPSIRPSEIGSPWALEGPAYFTDAAHQDHLHVGFDDPIDANWKPPEGDVPAPAEAGLPAAAVGVAENPPTTAPQADTSGDAEDGGDDSDDGGGGDEDEPDEDESGHDAWDESHESGSDEDSGGSGDDGSSESGSDEDSSGSGDDGSSESGSDEDSGSDSAPDSAAAPDDGALEVPDAGGEYPGDDAESPEVAAWMASEAQKHGLPAELPVMASLVESGMKNLSGGDADSVGFFQMRVGIWNKGAYSGYPDKPELQLQWFLDHAAAVKKQRVAQGLSVDDPKHYGEWIADVENPAAQYRGRYQLQLDEAQALLKKAGGKHSAGNGLDLVDSGGGGTHAGRRATAAVAEARKYLGTPYRWGGSTPKTGFDCSGLVQWAYAKAGIRIPRVTDQQILAANGTKVSRGHLLPGDLVFFRDPTGYVHHVGISLGGNRFLHAPHTGDVVKISSLKESYYAQQFTGGRRFDKASAAGEQVQAAALRHQSPPSAEEQAARLARAALDRDAREVQRSDSALFKALQRQEGRNPNEVQFLKAVEPARSP